MATRLKTIEYCFPTKETNLQAAGRFEFDDLDVYIPENSSRVFKSVFVEVTARQNDNTAVSPTSWTIGILLGTNTGSSFNDSTVTDTIPNSNEHLQLYLQRDVTSYFASNFGSGTSQKCQVAVVFGAVTTINITARLYITYEFSDTSQTTRIKTVRIPLDSPTGALTNTLTEIGTDQVPKLNTFCPELSKTYRDIFFEVSANEAAGSTSSFNLALSLDAESEDQDGAHIQGQTSSVWYRYLWKRTDLDPTVTHAFKARSTVTSRFSNLSIVLVVTYEYNHSTSTRLAVSLAMPWSYEGMLGGSASDNVRAQLETYIEEPVDTSGSVINLTQSGVFFSYSMPTSPSDINFRCGSQTYRAYTPVTGSLICGQHSLTHRFDSGGASGLGITISRGKVTLTIDIYQTSATNPCGMVGGVVYLNYICAKHADGEGAHNRTIIYYATGSSSDAVMIGHSSVTPYIPETNYWLNNFAALGIYMTTGATGFFQLSAVAVAGEGFGAAYHKLGAGLYQGSGENSVQFFWAEITRLFKQYPQSTDSRRLDFESSRTWTSSYSITTHGCHRLYYTYHTITYKIKGRVYGAVNLGRITVEAHRRDTGDLIGVDTPITDDTYQITWYDDTIDVYADGREASTDTEKVARSIDGRALT